MSLPLVTLPHINTPSLALSLLSDLLPRLSHSNSSIRKKTIVALYRLALVYPDTLRSAWPKIKDLLMDEKEDSSVTAAIINVICELGWRSPRDFLPLAPRLFELLVDGGNNWMAIKIIKLVSVAALTCTILINGSIVCNPDSLGATSDQETIASSDKSNSHYARNVPSVRMHKWHHSRRYIRGYRGCP